MFRAYGTAPVEVPDVIYPWNTPIFNKGLSTGSNTILDLHGYHSGPSLVSQPHYQLHHPGINVKTAAKMSEFNKQPPLGNIQNKLKSIL